MCSCIPEDEDTEEHCTVEEGPHRQQDHHCPEVIQLLPS